MAKVAIVILNWNGQKKAREIWFLCKQYSAKEAEQMGMVNKVVPLEKLEDTCVEWAEIMMERSPLALRMIWTGFAMNFFFVALGAICDAIPAAPYWTNQEGFHAIFGLAPRIAAASFVAFIVGSFANAYVMSVMKIRDGEIGRASCRERV